MTTALEEFHTRNGDPRGDPRLVAGVAGDFDFTDLGNARRVQERHGDTIRFAPGLGWIVSGEQNHWRRDALGEVDQRIVETVMALRVHAATLSNADESKRLFCHSLKWQSHKDIEATAARLRRLPQVAIDAESLDADPMLLGVQNGVVDLRTGNIRAARREEFVTRLAKVTANPTADCARWREVLARITADNPRLIVYLQKVLGLMLTGDISVQELWVFFGSGANGKSVIMDTLLGLLGDYATSAPDSLLMRGRREHPTELADLFGRRLVVASETDEGDRLRLQLVKKLTGDARIKGRFMRRDFFEFPRTHKIIMVTNNRPTVRENTEAVWRRVRLVPFEVTIPPSERDPMLLEKLRAEWPGILNWCIAGCLAWQREGLEAPPEVLGATEEYRAESDPLLEYREQRLIVTPTAVTARGDLLGDYQDWCRASREREPESLRQREFYAAIRRIPGVGEGQQRLGNNIPVRVFTGIGLALVEAL